jgi:DDB1- and CUL4-associated factor 13
MVGALIVRGRYLPSPEVTFLSFMKVKTISRDEQDYVARSGELKKVYTNLDPSLHTLERPKEYVRALNATKLERMFAKPFVQALGGHKDSVSYLAKHPVSLMSVYSGGTDGEVFGWNLSGWNSLWSFPAHRGAVTGMSVSPNPAINGRYTLLTCGLDMRIHAWPLSDSVGNMQAGVVTYMGKNAFQSVDWNWQEKSTFVSAGAKVDLWEITRDTPIHSFSWGSDTVHCVKFNPTESNIFVSSSSDRGIVLYDSRQGSMLSKVILSMKSNDICWNPMEAFNFVVANEDHNCYSFDMRKLQTATVVHKDHVSAVMSVDFAPTGQSFTSGAYDRTVRIFDRQAGHSKEVYHTKRMQRVYGVRWSMDNRYIFSASDDSNIRVWKAEASKPLKTLNTREIKAFNYKGKLQERFAALPEVKKIARHRHVPKPIMNAARLKRIVRSSAQEKDRRRRKHSAPQPYQAERKKSIVRAEE